MQTKPEQHATARPLGRWKRVFAIDPRSLALFRILAGSLLLYDLAVRAGEFQSMYAPGGVMPLDSIRTLLHYSAPYAWSLYFLSPAAAYQGAMFVIAAVFAAALLLGYRTRLATVASWVMLASIQMRTPFLINGGDVLIICLLFWGILLPLGGRWSLDVWLGRTRRLTEPVVSVPAVAILMQMFLMYLCTGLSKFNGVWLSGEALQNALSFDVFVRPLGRWLLNFPMPLRFITYATLIGELVCPFLLFFPWGNRYTRAVGLLFFLGLHVGIELTMTVVLFSFSGLVGLSLFLPTGFWESHPLEAPAAWLRRLLSQSWLRPRELRPPGRLAALLTDPTLRFVLLLARNVACGVLLGVIVVWNFSMTALVNYSGGIKLVQMTELPSESKNLTEGPSLDESGEAEIQLPEEVKPSEMPLPIQACGHFVEWATPILGLLKLDQRWDMFSHPPDGDYRFMARAHLRDGSVVDVLRGGVKAKIKDIDELAPAEPSIRWMPLYMSLTSLPPVLQQLWLAQDTAEYLRRTWDAAHGKDRRVQRLELILLQRVPHHPHASSQRTLVEIGEWPRLFIIRNSSGLKTAEGTIRYGLWQGKWKLFYPNGHKYAEGEFKNGLMEGPWTYWHKTGEKAIEGRWAAGKRQGTWTLWYASGQKSSQGDYVDGELDGRWVRWHENGELASDGCWEKGVQQGRWTFWYPNGRKEGEGDFLDGEMEGRWLMYGEDGSTRIRHYRNGQEVVFGLGQDITPSSKPP